LDNLDEGSHDLRKEDDSNQHENDSDKLLVPGDGVVVTIPNGRECGQSKVADDDHLSDEGLLAVGLDPLTV
jgi:hypothetical protein